MVAGNEFTNNFNVDSICELSLQSDQFSIRAVEFLVGIIHYLLLLLTVVYFIHIVNDNIRHV